jgi:hypothetical protein
MIATIRKIEWKGRKETEWNAEFGLTSAICPPLSNAISRLSLILSSEDLKKLATVSLRESHRLNMRARRLMEETAPRDFQAPLDDTERRRVLEAADLNPARLFRVFKLKHGISIDALGTPRMRRLAFRFAFLSKCCTARSISSGWPHSLPRRTAAWYDKRT